MTSARPPLLYDDPPYRLSGVVYGPLLNQRSALERLGDAVNQPPYKAPPKGPVLYMKPRNTLAFDGQRTAIPDGVQAMRVGATLGLVVGRAACRVSVETALDHVAGLVLVADLTVPHDTFYRPSAPFVARDASCFIGPRIVPLAQIGDPNAVALSLRVGDTLTDGPPVTITGLPNFAPEILRRVVLKDPTKTKQLRKALDDLSEEGVIQVFYPEFGAQWIVGVVGQLQLEVLVSRLEAEYKVEAMLEASPFATARWLKGSPAALNAFAEFNRANLAKDRDGDMVFMAKSPWDVGYQQEKNPELTFSATKER